MSDPAKHDAVVKLFEKLGGQAMVDESMRTVIEAVAAVLGDMPPEFVPELEQALAGDPTLMRTWIDALERAYDPPEIAALDEFYSTPHGQKMARSAPRMSAVIGAALMRWQKEVLMPLLTQLAV